MRMLLSCDFTFSFFEGEEEGNKQEFIDFRANWKVDNLLFLIIYRFFEKLKRI